MSNQEYVMGIRNSMRVYYGNSCNKCFSVFHLMDCPECKEVKYCSRQHQIEDWPFHKKICPLLRQREYPEGIDINTFLLNNQNFLQKMKEHLRSNRLSNYDREICAVPWVCVVCYSRKNLIHECSRCYSVCYCSIEHKRDNAEEHREICERLNVCRLFSSIGYQHGFKMEPLKFTYKGFREGMRHFPKDITSLMKQVQENVINARNTPQIFNLGLFADRYTAAATVLSCLDQIGTISNRKFNWLPNKTLQEVPESKPPTRNTRNKFSATLVIHVVAASNYELEIKWMNFVGLFLDWLRNVHHIKIILVGKDLLNCDLTVFQSFNSCASYEIHPCHYKDVVDRLTPPDVVVVYNIGYPKINCFEEFSSQQNVECLFKHPEVPVIITTVFQKCTNQFFSLIQKMENIETVKNFSVNLFSEFRALRNWTQDGLDCQHYNEFYAVFKKKE